MRQWVLSLPSTLRYQLAFDAALPGAVLEVFIGSVFAGLRRAAARAGIAGGPCGAITVIQRFGSALERIHDRVTRLLRRRGRLPEAPSPTNPVAEQMPRLAGYAAASIQERIAIGPGLAIACAACAPPPPWGTVRSSGAPA